MTKEISINSIREGILTITGNELTVITDQQIDKGDVLRSILHKRVDNTPQDILVDQVMEERPSKGDWKDAPPFGGKYYFIKHEKDTPILPFPIHP